MKLARTTSSLTAVAACAAAATMVAAAPDARAAMLPHYRLTVLQDLAGGANSTQAQAHAMAKLGATGEHAFRWSSTGGMTDLGDLAGGLDWSMAYTIHDSGWVAGAGRPSC